MSVPCPEVGKFFSVFYVLKVGSSGCSVSPGWEVLGVVHPQAGKF